MPGADNRIRQEEAAANVERTGVSEYLLEDSNTAARPSRKMPRLQRFLLFGVFGRPSRTVIPLSIVGALLVLAPSFLTSLSPEMMKTHMHVNMCPNITAVTNASLSPSNSGYALKAAKDSGNGVFSFLGALAAGCVADKMSRKALIFAGLIGGMMPYLALALTCDNAYYIPLSSLSGAFDSAVSVGVTAYIADLVPSAERATTFGRVLICPFVALSVASPLGAVYTAAYKESALRSVFWMAALLSVAPVAFALLFLAEPAATKCDTNCDTNCDTSDQDRSAQESIDGLGGLESRASPLVDRSGRFLGDGSGAAVDEHRGGQGTLQSRLVECEACVGDCYSAHRHRKEAEVQVLTCTPPQEAGVGDCYSAHRHKGEAGAQEASGPKPNLWTRELVVLVAINCLMSFGSTAITSLLVLYIANRFAECTEQCITLLYLLLTTSFILSSLLYLPVAIRVLGNVGTMMVGLLTHAAFTVCFSSAPSLNAVFLSFLLEVPAMGTRSCLMALFTAAVPKEHVGWASGVSNATYTLMQIVGPVFFAFMLTEWLRYPASVSLPGMPWFCAAALELVAFALTTFCLCVQRRDAPPLLDADSAGAGSDRGVGVEGGQEECCRGTAGVAAAAARGAGASGGARGGAMSAISGAASRGSRLGLPAAGAPEVTGSRDTRMRGGDRDTGMGGMVQPLLPPLAD